MQRKLTRRTLVANIAGILALSTAVAEEAKRGTPVAATGPETVVVFAAASLKNALDAVGKQWTAATGKKVTFSYAASGALARQIEAGAPADIFVSADLKWMDYAAEKKLIRPDTRVTLLGNKLVLVAPSDAKTTIKIAKGFDLAGAIGDGKLATGDPKSVPAGTYAKAALTSLGVWDAVAPKIAGTDSVRSALAFVARGEASFGIVYQTDAISEPKVKVVDSFPADSHPPIVYPFAITATSHNPAASDFLAYLTTAPAAKVFEAEGFTQMVK
jgi:molybdate transport system substrate-binding protein